MSVLSGGEVVERAITLHTHGYELSPFLAEKQLSWIGSKARSGSDSVTASTSPERKRPRPLSAGRYPNAARGNFNQLWRPAGPWGTPERSSDKSRLRIGAAPRTSTSMSHTGRNRRQQAKARGAGDVRAGPFPVRRAPTQPPSIPVATAARASGSINCVWLAGRTTPRPNTVNREPRGRLHLVEAASAPYIGAGKSR